MPRPPNPLTVEEKNILTRYVGYDADIDSLVWKPRAPEDFFTREPERTAEGFNRAKAGKPIAFNSNNGFTIKVPGRWYRFTENKVRAYLGAPHIPMKTHRIRVKPEISGRHPHARPGSWGNANPDGNVFEKDIIKDLMWKCPEDGYLYWKKRFHREDTDLLTELMARTKRSAAYEASLGTIRALNVQTAGKRVQITTSGVVKLLRIIHFGPHVLEAVFPGCKIATTEVPETPRPRPVDDETLRALIEIGPAGEPVWRVRDKASWFRAVLAGIEKEMRTEAGIVAWNARFAGRRLHLDGGWTRYTVSYRVGKRSATANRIKRACGEPA